MIIWSLLHNSLHVNIKNSCWTVELHLLMWYSWHLSNFIQYLEFTKTSTKSTLAPKATLNKTPSYPALFCSLKFSFTLKKLPRSSLEAFMKLSWSSLLASWSSLDALLKLSWHPLEALLKLSKSSLEVLLKHSWSSLEALLNLCEGSRKASANNLNVCLNYLTTGLKEK